MKVNPFLVETASSLIEEFEAENDDGLKANEETAKDLSLVIEILLFDAIAIAPPESIKLFFNVIPEVLGEMSFEIIVRSPADFILASEEIPVLEILLKSIADAIFTELAAFISILEPVEVVERFEPMMLISLFGSALRELVGESTPAPIVVKVKFPALAISLPILVELSFILIPICLLFLKKVSSRLRSCRVEMLISSPAVIEILPEV